MNNKFLELVSSPLMNLDHTYRYSGTKLVEPESLSQHIVDTIMMGLKIIDKINSESTVKLDATVYVMKAIFHDLEEVITGDIPRPLKYYNQATLQSLRGVADSVASKFFESQFHDSEDAYTVWSNAKDGREGYILKVVDMLVVASKVVKEVSLLNNNYMLRVAHEVSSYLVEVREDLQSHVDDLFEGDQWTFNVLLSVIEDAISAMNDILSERENVMNNINIRSQSMM